MAIVESGVERSLREGLRDIRQPLSKAAHAPGYVYSSPEVLALEKEKMFMQDWLFMAREEELAKPGDFMTFRVLGEPLVLTRDANGKLNAFANVCVHRGVEVAIGTGNTKEFMCPYHGWLYDLEGRLVGAPYMKEAEGFDPKNCRLAPLRIGVWRRCVFVTFNPDAPPLETQLAQFERDFAFLHPEKCKLSKRLVWEFECNWKLLSENAMDMYHVGTLHRSTFGAGTSVDDAKISLYPRGGMRIDYQSVPMTPSNQPLFGKLPWLEHEPVSFATMGFMQPNTHMVARSDQVRMLTGWPLGPNRCQVIMYSLFPEEYFERPDFAEKAEVYHQYLTRVLNEDREMVKSLQHAMEIQTYVPGRLATLEKAIHHVLNGALDRLFEERPAS